jgi:proteasome lid subunit RPN8/RPN11
MSEHTSVVVDCGDEVREQVRAHVDSDLEREVGGFLVGTLRDGRARVELAIPALRAEGHRANVTFTHEVWDDVLATLDREHPELNLVGWYHSHPGFGIFLSEYDQFIHQNFFPADGMVALVVDPHTGAQGWFGSEGGEVVRLDGPEGVSTPRDRPSAPPAPVSSAPPTARTRGAIALVGSAALLAGLVGGWLIGDTSPVPVDDTESTGQLAAAEARTAELTAALETAQQRADEAEQEAAELLEPAEEPDSAETRESFPYRVRPGDTLRGIATLLAPDEEGYLQRIVDGNPQLDDPDVIRAGSELRLPLPRE